MNGLLYRITWALLLVIAAAHSAFAAPPCGGDCDHGGEVTVDELVKGVGIALATASVEECRNMDGDADGVVTVDELVGAVSNALNGCPTAVGEFFGTVNLDAGRSATMDLDVQADGQANALVVISAPAAGLGALPAGRGAAPLFSFMITGNVDLDTGAYTMGGTFLDDGVPRTVNVNGMLPLQPTGQGTFNFQVDVDNFTGSVVRANGSTPTPTPTQPATNSTPTATATPIAGGPVDPALLGTWSGTARNESTGFQKQVRIKIELQGNDVVVSDLGGNLYKTAPASIVMTAPTRTTLIYNVAGNPVINFNLSLVGSQLGGIYGATTVALPPIVDAVGLVLTKEVPLAPDPRLAGTWSGTAFGSSMFVRLRLEVQGNGVVVTDLIGDLFIHIPSSVTALPEGVATAITYICDTGACGNGNPVVSVNLSLLPSGRLVGGFYAATSTGPVSVSINLGRE